MSDIRFDLNYMNIILGDGYKAENEVSDSIHGMQKLTQKMEGELSSFSGEGTKSVRSIQAYIYEIRDLMSELDRKSSNAEKQRQKELKPPTRPSVPSNATPEQKNAIMSAYNDKVSQVEKQNAEIRKQNERIDAYISKCNEAKSKLEAEISALHQIEATIKSEIELAVTRVHEFMGQAHGINNQGARVNSAMSEFNQAFREAYDSAERLYLMEPSSISAYSFNDKQFVIKNTHSHILGSSGVSFNYSSEHSEIKEAKKEKPKIKADELLIKDKDECAFFEKLAGENKIKMPSANLHRLGGKKFTEKMNSLGYTLVTQADGSTIDINGMLHWEKSDD